MGEQHRGRGLTSKDIILDTNAVLRFITGDDSEKCLRVSEILDKNDCFVPVEVIAEAVYNLDKFYRHPRQLIADEIKDFISIKENLVFDANLIKYGCNVFASTNMDFVDCLLVGYSKVNGNSIFSFDDILNKQLGHNKYNQ